MKQEEARDCALPNRIVDAINILRHVKIGQWETGQVYDEEKYNPAAQAIADGTRDREKQSAFYVGVSKSGEILNRPDETSEEAIRLAIDRSGKVSSALDGLLTYGLPGVELERLLRNLKVMFASEEELRQLFPEAGCGKIVSEIYLSYGVEPDDHLRRWAGDWVSGVLGRLKEPAS